MEGHELFARMTRVKAPEGFEDGVLARLPSARRERARARRAAWRFAFAGSAAFVLAGFFLVGPALFEKGAPILTYAEREALAATPSVPVYERMDYAAEFRNAQHQPRTVYILEQVSETVSSEIIY